MKFSIRVALLSIAVLLVTACVNKPTQNTTVVDDRPRVTFAADLGSSPKNYSVHIDGIAYGSLANFMSDKNALRIISGRHKIDIIHNDTVVKTYDVTLGANETRVLKVTHGK
ncbi:hypothetical protein [Teredinibacter waterburyi]|uniref:hypothetical protein n=1 Tax=Teredinibacter waterburyi TaxID=1500538 RepID=UPI00165F49E8|nr:hypothetical protein [Teredinibacter waterburyi]